MEHLKYFFSITLISFALFSCGNYEEFKEDPSTPFGNSALISDLNFDEVNTQVFQARCLKCHANYDNYDTIKSNLESIVRTVRVGSMPKDGPMVDSKISLLLSWAAAGAPRGNTSEPPPTQENELKPTYLSLGREVFAAKCVFCHNPDGQVPWVPLESRLSIWEQREFLFDFETPESSYLLEIIQDPFEPMPPIESGIPQVTKKEVEILKEWIRLGLP